MMRKMIGYFILMIVLVAPKTFGFGGDDVDKQVLKNVPKSGHMEFEFQEPVKSLMDLEVELISSDGKVTFPARRLVQEKKVLVVFSPTGGYDSTLKYTLKISLKGEEEEKKILFIREFTAEGYIEDGILYRLLQENEERLPEGILAEDNPYGIQILYTEVSRDGEGTPSFKSYEYNVQEDRYFYPASSIKLSSCILALDKLNNMNIDGVSKYSVMTSVSSYFEDVQEAECTIEGCINSILLQSSNLAFNRLVDFLGYDYYNKTLKTHNFLNTRVQHKLLIDEFDKDKRAVNETYFLNEEGEKIYSKEFSSYNYRFNNGGMDNLHIGDKNFKYNNYSSLYDLQEMMKVVFFNEYLDEKERFNLTPADILILKRGLRGTRHKYLMAGGDINSMPDGVELYNKYGQAYGHFIENAYIKDSKSGKEFLLTAVIYANENELMDGIYQYKETAIPFLKELGRIVLEHTRKESVDN